MNYKEITADEYEKLLQNKKIVLMILLRILINEYKIKNKF